MDHGLEIETRVIKDLRRLAESIGAPVVATNDLHYTKHEDSHAHEVLLCVQSGSTLADPDRFKFDTDQFYLKSAEEMRRTWAEIPEACDNTAPHRGAVRGGVQHRRQLHAELPRPGGGERGLLVHQGGRDRPAEAVPRRRSRRTCARRRSTRRASSPSSGSPGYFLVVADFINWAKDQGIRVGPGRGSAAGSMASYAMGITELDPLEHGLIFERFLNPERVSWPDVDVDFDERRRGEVIRYVTDKYGEDRVAQIVTYGTIKAKQALKDASPRARLPVRDGGEAHQGDAARGDGQGHHARRASTTRRTRATRRPTSSARWCRPTPRRSACWRPPRGWRTSSGSGACTRPASSCRASRWWTSSRSCGARRTARSSRSSTSRGPRPWA